jgi:hypothetical protein
MTGELVNLWIAAGLGYLVGYGWPEIIFRAIRKTRDARRARSRCSL